MSEHQDKKVVVIGAGSAGLTAAYQLSKSHVESVVLEKDNFVGGLARTGNYKGYYFDIGGHRFFTKVKAVEDMWHAVMGPDFLNRDRLSRIYFNKRFFHYPLRASNALLGLGIWNCLLILLSYFKAQFFPQKPEETFEQWVSNRFGKRLFNTFFKTYTEKVWGMPCSQISAEWAAQRVKGLSLLSALKNAFLKQPNHNKGAIIKTLIDSFHYPKLGPGMMWDSVADDVQQNGCTVQLGTDVESILWADNRVEAVHVRMNGHTSRLQGTHFISSMPIRELIHRFDPAPPKEVLQAASDLNYRDFLTVVLIIDKPDVFPDNWIYVHDPDVEVGRIQNFKNWSPYMVPDQNKTCLGLEYFCFEGDGLWEKTDEELIELGKRELEQIGLIQTSDVEDGTALRVPKAYPVYDSTYRKSIQTVREFLKGIGNLQLIGRNGMHKYNNQDHSMLTAMLAADNVLGANHDIWKINVDQEYQEEVTVQDEKTDSEFAHLETTQPRVPMTVDTEPYPSISDEVLIRAFAKMDKLSLAVALGSVCGLVTFVATLWLIMKGGEPVGPHLQLLNQYFIGYSVTLQGAFIGMIWSFFWGFIWGWLFAYLRNFFLGLYIYIARKRNELLYFRDFLDLY